MRGARLITAKEFESIARNERCELVDGRVVPMTTVSLAHAAVVGRLNWLLGQYAYPRKLGIVGPELGVRLTTNPDTVLGPDVVFVRRERFETADKRHFLDGAPDLVIEVKSPDDSMTELRRKAQKYLSHGTPLVVLVDPITRTALIHRRDAVPVTLKNEDDVVDFDSAVPGFHCTLADIFG